MISRTCRTMVCQRSRRIHSRQGFFGSFDAPWSEWFLIDLFKKRKIHFWIFSDLRTQSFIFFKKRALGVSCVRLKVSMPTRILAKFLVSSLSSSCMAFSQAFAVVLVDLIRRSWVRFPPRSKEFFPLPRVVPWFSLLGLTPSGSFKASHSALIYSSELILCTTICVHSDTRHNSHMYPYFLFAAIHHLNRPRLSSVTVDLIRRSWVRFPPPVKTIFFFTSCGSLVPFTRANAQWVFHGLHIAL